MPSLFNQPIHLGLGAPALARPDFTAMKWYAGYLDRHADDGIGGRLVSMSTFTQNGTRGKCTPGARKGVICVAGAMTIHQELADGSKPTVALAAGDYAINPPGAWHIADVADSAAAVFVTADWGDRASAAVR
jgi:hypothetical protein